MSEIVFNDTTEAEVVGQFCDRHCEGKFVVLTGGSINGIGFEVARILAKFGAEVLITCRSQAACKTAIDSIQEQFPNAILHSCVMDLSSFISIRTCAEYIFSLGKPINILINNAGIMETTSHITTDGFEKQWQVNYLGPFYFTQLLLPSLIAAGTSQYPSRVVMTSSVMNYLYVDESGIDFKCLLDDTQLPRDAYYRYGESKLAVIMFAKELTKRMEQGINGKETNVIAVALHPGICPKTRCTRSMSLTSLAPIGIRLYMRGTSKIFRKQRRKTISQAAATTVFCALHHTVEAGEYYADCAIDRLLHKQVDDEPSWAMLWEISESQVSKRLEELSATTNQFHLWHQL